jgi:hypothetical protein
MLQQLLQGMAGDNAPVYNQNTSNTTLQNMSDTTLHSLHVGLTWGEANHVHILPRMQKLLCHPCKALQSTTCKAASQHS